MKVCSAKWFRVSNFRFRGLYAFRHLGCRALEVQGCYDLDAETLNRGVQSRSQIHTPSPQPETLKTLTQGLQYPLIKEYT